MLVPPRRYPTLDLLRLVAIGMTMMFHTQGVLERVALLRPFRGGLWLGVDLFMLISGWLLGGQLLRDAAANRLEPLRFYVKRWLRTLPPYYVMLALLFFAGTSRVGGLDGTELELDPNHFGWAEGQPWWVALTHLTFLQRYIPPNLYGVSWSLCVEEHFYLALPLVVFLLMRWPRLGFVAGLVVFAEVVGVTCRFAVFTGQEWAPQLTHMRCHGLFVGLMLAWSNIHRPALWASIGRYATWLAIVGCVLTPIVVASVPPHPAAWAFIGAPTAGTWTFALVFIACVHERSAWSRVSFPGLQYLGELTYPMYLVHNVIPRAWMGGHSGEGGARGMALRIALVLGLSIALHHGVERPALALRERVLKKWRPAAPAAIRSVA